MHDVYPVSAKYCLQGLVISTTVRIKTVPAGSKERNNTRFFNNYLLSHKELQVKLEHKSSVFKFMGLLLNTFFFISIIKTAKKLHHWLYWKNI